MIEFLVWLAAAIAYLGLGARFAATKYVQRDVQRQLDEIMAKAADKDGRPAVIAINATNDRAMVTMRKSAAAYSMFILPIWPIYMACVKTHEYIVKNAHPTTYDLNKVKKEAENREKEFKKRLAELEAQDAEYRRKQEGNGS